MKNTRRLLAKTPSWGDVKIDCTSMCELDEVIRQVLGGAE